MKISAKCTYCPKLLEAKKINIHESACKMNPINFCRVSGCRNKYTGRRHKRCHEEKVGGFDCTILETPGEPGDSDSENEDCDDKPEDGYGQIMNAVRKSDKDPIGGKTKLKPAVMPAVPQFYSRLDFQEKKLRDIAPPIM